MTERMTAAQYRELLAKAPKPSKYHNKPCWHEGEYFQSQRECHRWIMLGIEQRHGDIRNLRRQVPYDLPGGIKYVADFVYERKQDDGTWREVIEDSKGGVRTKDYILKRKLMLAHHGIEILET